jgi:hypothetical protein
VFLNELSMDLWIYGFIALFFYGFMGAENGREICRINTSLPHFVKLTTLNF